MRYIKTNFINLRDHMLGTSHLVCYVCLLCVCLSYITSHGIIISRANTMPLGVGVHPPSYKMIDWYCHYSASLRFLCFVVVAE